jgi:hypothetical protein
MLMSYQESSELTEPRVGPLDDPAALVAAQFPPVFVAPLLVVLSIRGNQLDASFLQSLAQRVRIVGAIGDHPFRLLPRAAFGSRDADFFERGFRKRSFSRRGTFKPNSQRKTLTVDQYHPLRSLAALGFTDCRAPFLAGAKLPSRKVSSHRSNPSPSNAPSNVRQASSQTSCSSHCFKRRQQVAGEGYLSGRNRHAAPVHNTQRMPSKQSRFDAQGRPRLSRRRLGSGNSGSIRDHCASVNSSNRRVLTLPVSQTQPRLKKYPS